ncbi:putative FAD-dependent oxidoreductase LodB [Enhygromyxa salina]|uniref:Putative FAD-dependent oxidoreductase LodB n=1 Tax=Enhygromyxa salina TaxID=215803 RepID=A0A2S9YF63_9BACT|nr:NAD(P)/FAD-dependent oxidoreductase [Enhygromyxa salina]PRQ03681.1 putative FAD-dependent oxidoreductase LodB [Enhygromyxa salina]
MGDDKVHDVIIVGGGPAGSCAANLLAGEGAEVVVLERERFPRFHVGESLLPTELAVLERLGVDLDAVPFLRKHGAVFIDERSGRSSRFSFDEGLPGTPDHAHQIDRATFDHELLRAAARAGARVRERHEVVDVELGADEVRVRVRALAEPGGAEAAAEYELRGRYLVDATGHDTLLARRSRSVEPYRGFGRAAAFRHYRGLAPEINAELHERGDVIVKIVDDGWMWVIPLITGDMSVGLVKAKGKLEAALLEREIAESPLLQRLSAGAQPSPIRLIGNFSYRNTTPQGPRFACIGDAACFLDPIFSSGVALAFAGAERLADLLGPALREGREAEAELMVPLREHMERAYDAFHRFIHRFYHTRLADNLLLAEGHTSHNFRAGVISMLAADVWRDDNPFQNMLLRARRV